ncbi:transposase family protein [Streptomyces sp. NPDC057494]|uniref:transposase family protein n=1 Tax=Streptomyces sp. NPDC057494 TaxID=3346148 RepID=UPI00367D764C
MQRWLLFPDHVRVVGNGSRAAITSNRRITGQSADVIVELVAEVGPLWHERHQARLESRPRKRAVGGGAKHRLVFIDRLLATLVHLRHGTAHDVPACWFGVDRSTITRAIGEVRPLLAERGCTVAAGIRPRTLSEVLDHLGASGQTGITDGTEIRVRRPAAGRKDRDKFNSGKNKQNAVKSMVLTDATGRLLLCSPAQSASCADITHARQLGLVMHLTDGPSVEILADGGYQGLGAQTGGRVVTPPHRKSKKTRRTGTRRSTNASARPTPHAVSASSTASHTSRTGDHSPALWGDVGSSSDPGLMGSRLEGLSRMSRWTRGRRSLPDRRLPPLT